MKIKMSHSLFLKTILISSFGLFLSIFVLYGNCASEVDISKKPIILKMSTDIPEFKICSQGEKLEQLDDFNALFLVDMSRSNIGTFTPNKKSTYDYSYTFNKSTGTDVNGLRFESIKLFISKHPKARFKIIPFSSEISFAAYPEFNCSTKFISANDANQNIEKMIAWQKAEISLYETNITNYRVITAKSFMMQTDYQKAFECSFTSLKKELENLNAKELEKSHYKLFFVTDGKPKPPDVISPDVVQSFFNKVKEMSIYTSIAGSFQVIPIYYGSAEGTTNELDKNQAINLLQEIGKAGQWINTKSPDNLHWPLVINDVNDIDFNDIYMASLFEPSRIIEFNVVNLNAKIKENQVLSDTDMDGLADEEDESPISSRSNKESLLLDPICQKLGGPGQCKAPEACLANLASPSFGLSDCDFKALGLLIKGFDQDFDLIPDFIELRTGSSLITNDANTDADGDGLSNIDEIHQSSSPMNPNNPEEKDLIRWTRQIETNEPCAVGQETWRFDNFHLPLVKTKAYSMSPNDPLASFQLSHEENENVFLLIILPSLKPIILENELFLDTFLKLKLVKK